MKKLKTYRRFLESNSEEMFGVLNDMCLQLRDDGFATKPIFSVGVKNRIEFRVYKSKRFYFNDIKVSILEIIEYMESEGFFIDKVEFIDASGFLSGLIKDDKLYTKVTGEEVNHLIGDFHIRFIKSNKTNESSFSDQPRQTESDNLNLTNKFNFVIGKEYSFDELPQNIKDDIYIQFDEYSDLQPEDYYYVAKLLKPEETEEYLHNQFGEYNIQDALEEPYMKKIIRDIQINGLDYPAVGIEGNHRALAFWYLKKDLPYLEMIEITKSNKTNESSFSERPTGSKSEYSLEEDKDFISDTCLELDEKGFKTCGTRTQIKKINVVQFGKSPVLKINETTPYFIIGHPRGRYFKFSEIKDELLQIKSYLGDRWIKCGVLFESEVERIEVFIDEKGYDHLDDWFHTSTSGIVNLVVFFNI